MTEENTFEESIKKIEEQFISNKNKAQKEFDEISRNFWINKLSEIKENLTKVVTNSKELEENKKRNLEKIILNFENLNFSNTEDKYFDSDKFQRVFSYRVKIEKVEEEYEKQMQDAISEICSGIKEIHRKNFNNWVDELKSSILGNLKELSPKLRTYLENIRMYKRERNDLICKKAMLENYSRRIDSLISWI